MDEKNNKILDDIQSKMQQGKEGQTDDRPTLVKDFAALTEFKGKAVNDKRLNIVNRDFEPFWFKKEYVIELEQYGFKQSADCDVRFNKTMLRYIKEVNPDFARDLVIALNIVIDGKSATIDFDTLEFEEVVVSVGDLASLSSILSAKGPNDERGHSVGDYQRMCLNFFVFATLLHASCEGITAMKDLTTTVLHNINTLREKFRLQAYCYMPSFKLRPFDTKGYSDGYLTSRPLGKSNTQKTVSNKGQANGQNKKNAPVQQPITRK